MATPISQLEGKYEIIDRIKEGGMGAVYKVRHRLLDEIRVVKLIRPQLESDEAIKARFLREARTAVKMRHENIAQFYDFSIDKEGNAFIVMEFIEGVTLEDLLRAAGPPPPPLTLEVAEQSLRALGYLHRRSIVHRDISPDNLMLTQNEDGEPRVKLIDLGIAKALEGGSHLTTTGTFIGKVRYASPEQFRSQEGAGVDARSDLYSFGIVLYELLTGKHPIPGDSLSAVIAGHLFREPLPFAQSDPQGRVPEALRAIVLHAIRKAPEQRFQSAQEMLDRLRKLEPMLPLDAAQLAEVLQACHLPRVQPRTGKAGTTQERLNQQFAIGGTPTPSAALQSIPSMTPPGPVAPPPDSETVKFTPPPLPPSDQVEIDSLLSAARDLATSGRLADARDRLSRLLEKAPGHAQGTTLLREVEAAASRAEEESKRAAALADAQGRVEALIASGALDRARQALQEAQGTFGDAGSLPALAKRLEDTARALEVQGLIQSARVLGEAGRYDDAVSTLEHALRLEPENKEAAGALASARMAARAEAERRRLAAEEARRRREIGERVLAIAAALDAGDLDGAAAALERGRREFGEPDELRELGEKLAKRRAERARAAAAELLVRAAAARAGGDLGEAARCVREAARLDPASREATELLARIQAEIAAEQARKERQDLVARHVKGIEGLLGAGQLDGAESALQAASRELGDDDALLHLRARLGESRLAQARAAAEVRLRDARTLQRAGKFAEAIARAEEAASLDPSNEAPGALLAELRENLRERHEKEKVERAVADATVRVERLVKAGDLDGATRAIETAAASVGRHAGLDAARSRVDEARRARIASEAEGLVRNARTLARAARYSEARETLDRARRLDPDSKAIAAAADELAAQQAKWEAERRVEASSKAAVAEVERLLREGAVDRAAARLEAAIVEVGERNELKSLRKQVKKAAAAVPAGAPEPPGTGPAAAPGRAVPSPAPPRTRGPWPLLLGGVAVAVLAIVVVSVVRRPAEPPPEPALEQATPVPATEPAVPAATALLVVDARPWGEVTSIRDDGGSSVGLPAARITPLAVDVPAGRYTVTVRQPDSGRELTAQVSVGAGGGQVAVEFPAPTLDEFLRMVGY
jgi:serine/threonine-protein kinase